MLRAKLKMAGGRLHLSGGGFRVPRWRSADKDDNQTRNRLTWFTSRLVNGYLSAYDPHRRGQQTSIHNIGAGRATTYLDCGYSSYCVEGVYEGNTGLSAITCAAVSPDEWEHNIAPFPEIFLNPAAGFGPWVIWWIGAPAAYQGIPVYGGGQIQVPGESRNIQIEVIGRRARAYVDNNDTYEMEIILPQEMEGSSLVGVTHDVALPWISDGAGGWVENPVFGVSEGQLEANFKVRPITHFRDEAAGTLGAELLQNTDFTSASNWTIQSDWVIDSTNTDGTRPHIAISMADSGTPFVSGYLRQTLSSPLESGKQYRLTFSLDPASDQVPNSLGSGTFTVELFNGGTSAGVVGPTSQTGGNTYHITATGAHDTIEVLAQSQDASGTHKLNRRMRHISLREFTPA